MHRALSLAAMALALAATGCSLVTEPTFYRALDAHVDDAPRFDAADALDAADAFDAANEADALDALDALDAPDVVDVLDAAVCSPACTAPAQCVGGVCRTDCGAPGILCCAGDACAAGLRCVPDGAGAMRCAFCGTAGERCCAEPAACGPGLACTPLIVPVCLPPTDAAPNTLGGPCVPVAVDSCVDAVTNCPPDPCPTGQRCLRVPSTDTGRCVRCGVPGETCCTGTYPMLPFHCPDVPTCANQQEPTALCGPAVTDAGM